MKHVMPTYSRLNLSFTHGKGSWLWDQDGNKYLDALSGIAVTGLGHANTLITKKIVSQLEKVTHVSNLFKIPPQEQLAKSLCKISDMENVFFCNSGCEANEAAIKIARLYGYYKKIKSPKIIVMGNSFHGRTMATLSATGNKSVQKGFNPLLGGFIRVPYNNISSIHNEITKNKNIVAILVEPVQGEGGIIVPHKDYLRKLRSLCDKKNILLILDEVQTGMGRTGEWFAFQHSKVKPDIITMAKGLGNGIPIGACLANKKTKDLLKAGTHGSTFGGNPIACVSGITTIEIIERKKLLSRAKFLGEIILKGIMKETKKNPNIKDIRGKGLMLGIELNRPCYELVKKALDLRIILNVTSKSVIRLLPPLILTNREANLIVKKVSKLINEF